MARAVALCLGIVATAVWVSAGAPGKRPFDVPADLAEKSLRVFSVQSGSEVLFSSDAASGVRTNAIKGEFLPGEAVKKMLVGTTLYVRDERDGVFRIAATPRPKAPGAALNPGQNDRPGEAKSGARSRDPPPGPSSAALPNQPQTAQPQHNETPPVKKQTFVTILTGWLLAAAPAASAQETGTIEGRVFNAATGEALINARVQIDGTTRQAITDESGSYRLAGVPAGEARLAVTYIGMEREPATVNVPAGGTVQREFELRLAGTPRPGDVVKLDAFTVVADREMSAQALAMNEQRHAPNIKNVVAIDEFGDRGNENIGEFLLFLPGVSVTTSGQEATSVSLRGFPGNNTGLMIDGGSMASSFGGNSRALDLREVPMNNISRVEITKVPTPDMPASGLGGSINLISRGGFESRRPKFSFDAYSLFHSSRGLSFAAPPRNHAAGNSPNHLEPSFNFSYLGPVNENLAITLGGSRTFRYKPPEGGTEHTNETATWDLVQLVQTSSQWQSIPQVVRTLSGQFGIDWRISPRDTLSASLQYRDYSLYITRSVLTFAYGAGAIGSERFVQGAPTGVGTVTMNGSGENNNVVTETKHYTLKYRHRGDTWRLEAGGSYSTSASDRPDIDEGFFNTTPAVISNLILRGDDIPTSGGTIPTRYSALTRTGSPVDLLNGANYSINSGNTNQADWNTQQCQLRADLARDLRLGVPVTLRLGVAFDRTERDMRRDVRTWNFRPNGASDAASRLAGRFDVFDDAFNAASPTLYGQRVRWVSGQKLYALFQQQPAWFVEDAATSHQNFVNNSLEFTESISAAYVRTDTRLLENRLWLVAGVRFERTDAEGRGPLNDINAQYQRNADGSFVRNAAGQRVLITSDPLALRRLRFVERGAGAKRDYSGFYPSLNATYSLSEKLVLRAAGAKSLGRPNINFIIPGTTVSDPEAANPAITVNNTGLSPWTATSCDLSLESYHFKDGFGSMGLFRKRVKNFFGTVSTQATPALLELYGLESDPALLNYTINTRTNAGDATIDGFELGYRQSLTFLPYWARGLQVFVNATKLKLSGNNTADFTGYNPESLSGGINFVRPRLIIKGTVSHLGDVRQGAVNASATIPAGTFNYQAKRTRFGLSAEFSLSRNFSVYASATDLGGFLQNLQRYAADTPDYAKGQRWTELGFNTTLGIRGKF